MTTRVIFFDAVGTLFTVRGSVGEVYSRVVADYGVVVDPQVLNRAFYRVFEQAPAAAFPEATPEQVPELERRWWREVVLKTFEGLGLGGFPGFEAYFQEVYDLFAEAQVWMLYPETLPVLDYLQRRGIPMGIISNFDSRLFAVLASLGLTGYFESITSSSTVGYAKPSPRIFRQALEKHGIPAPQALHIGDSFRQDFQGALQSGLQGLWLNREGSASPRGGEIRDLWGIRGVLEQAV
ncbi:MAG: HAD-IA family hydrolase [Thermostichales cyanobacterium SZTDM-1c_bins_54]